MFAPLPAAPPVTPPVTTGAVQVYVVPAGIIPFVTLKGDDAKVPPLHTVAVIAVTAGIGLTVTVTVNGAPVQLPDVGVTVYVAVCAEFVGLLSIPLMFAAAVPVAPPVIPPVTTGTGHVYVVAAGTIPLAPFAGTDVKRLPLHIAAVIAVIDGFGSTVTVTVKSGPVQLPDVGVTV